MATGNAVHVDECHSDRIAGITFENWGHISPVEFTRKREKVRFTYVLIHDVSNDLFKLTHFHIFYN